MKIPELHGDKPDNDFFIYTACDSAYFEKFAKPLVRSIQQNSYDPVHIHIFNPGRDQIVWCRNLRKVSVSWEYVESQQLLPAADVWTGNLSACEKIRYLRILNAMKKGNDNCLLDRIVKTYYACARFIRLNQLFSGKSTVFSIDVDGIVRKSIKRLYDRCDFYIHRIDKKDPRFLAGGIYLNPTVGTQEFLSQYSQLLIDNINRDYLYWSMDQDLLENLVVDFKFNQLPLQYIDWYMKDDSYIWTAKGARKESNVFISECERYAA